MVIIPARTPLPGRHNTVQTPQYWVDTSILCASIAVYVDTDDDSRKGEEAGLPLTTPHCSFHIAQCTMLNAQLTAQYKIA